MVKYTTSLQKKIELILKESGYTIRYEKGNFKPGYCILESKNVVVVNKYYPLDAKISSLMDILSVITIHEEDLSEESIALLHKLKQTELSF